MKPSTTKRMRSPLQTNLICSIAKRLASTCEPYEQDELIWRLTAALHSRYLPDADHMSADANAALVCLTTGVDVPSIDTSSVVASSSDVAAALDTIETPSVASVRAVRVASVLATDNECFTGSELVDWANAMDAVAPALTGAQQPSRPMDSRRPSALSVPFEQRCASAAMTATAACTAIQTAKVVAASAVAKQVPDATAVLAPNSACISPISTLDLP